MIHAALFMHFAGSVLPDILPGIRLTLSRPGLQTSFTATFPRFFPALTLHAGNQPLLSHTARLLSGLPAQPYLLAQSNSSKTLKAFATHSHLLTCRFVRRNSHFIPNLKDQIPKQREPLAFNISFGYDNQRIKANSFLAPFSLDYCRTTTSFFMEFNEQPVIFVVEDNLIYQGLIAKELESVSRNIHFYTTGEACVSELDKHPSVIVLDYNLEGPMNGLDTLQQVRGVHPQVYVILFSSQKGLNTKEAFSQYGSFDYLEKNNMSLRTLQQMVSYSLTSNKSLGH